MSKELFSKEAEQAVLGSIMYHSVNPNLSHHSCLPMVSHKLKADDFYDQQNRAIYAVMIDLQEQGIEIDLVSLAEKLKKDGKLDAIGGLPHLTQIANSMNTDSNVMHYIEIVKEMSVHRTIEAVGREISSKSKDFNDSPENIVVEAQKKLAKAIEAKNLPTPQENMMTYMDVLNRRYEGAAMPLATGILDFDRLAGGGIRGGELLLIGARPGMGKTALALCITLHLCKNGYHVLFVSLEMPREQINDRFVAIQTHINLKKIRKGKDLTENEWSRIFVAAENLTKMPLYIDDTSGQTVTNIISTALSIKAQYGLDCIIVDHLHVITDNKQYFSDASAIGDRVNQLKGLAKQLNVPVVLLAQLNRDTEGRQDKLPTLADFKGSGGIEENADIATVLYRPGYYTKDKKNAKALLEIVKARNAELGPCYLTYLAPFTHFVNGEPWDKAHSESSAQVLPQQTDTTSKPFQPTFTQATRQGESFANSVDNKT